MAGLAIPFLLIGFVFIWGGVSKMDMDIPGWTPNDSFGLALYLIGFVFLIVAAVAVLL